MPESPTKPFSGIFVSYRRDDSSGHAGRLFDRLVSHFGKDRIFMDIDTIDPGEDFVTVIENAVGSCEVLIAVIGRHWLASADDSSARRLDNPHDFVRLEIATALSRDIRVIPVLVQRASMPKPEDLPDDLAKFSRRNALELSDLRWQHDVDRLFEVMERTLATGAEAWRELAEARTREREEGERRSRDDAKRRAEEERVKAKTREQLSKLSSVYCTKCGERNNPAMERCLNCEALLPSNAKYFSPGKTSAQISRPRQAVLKYTQKRTILVAVGLLASFAVIAGIVLGVSLLTRQSPEEPKSATTTSAGDKPTVEPTNGPKLAATASENAARGTELFNQEKYVEAEAYYREAVRLEPGNGVYKSYLGAILFRQQRYAEAEVYDRESLGLQPFDAVVRHNLAEVLFRQQKYTEAETQYREAVRLQPANALFQNNLGVVLQQLGRYAEAETCFWQSVKFLPGNAVYRDNLGNALAAQQKHAEALVQYREAVRLDPGNTTYQQHLNASEQSSKQNSQSRKKSVVDPVRQPNKLKRLFKPPF